MSPNPETSLDEYLEETRALVIERLDELLPRTRDDGGLYELMRDYPRRGGKMLRPAICLAMGRALGGSIDSLLPSAVVLELYHSAFLIHDDVEDESELRRGRPTMHRAHGIPIAVHVGDAMLAACLRPLLDNVEIIGLGPALAVLEEIATMARETAEGQMMELRLASSGHWDLPDATYLRLIHKKTSWYSFIAPLRVAGIIVRSAPSRLASLFRLGTLLGSAFQLQDDVLSLRGEAGNTGKDTRGDLWEGKHTVILAHALRTAPPRERARALEHLARRRSTPVERCIEELRAEGALSEVVAERLRGASLEVERTPARDGECVRELQRLIEQQGSLVHARALAARHAAGARRSLEGLCVHASAGPDLDFLEQLVAFVGERSA
ncbi:MAG: polyprenyl synthetase family protein [Myxococcales bacterium]|nr:polyprenyl synthetase family protein [Myxococcales bacterium]